MKQFLSIFLSIVMLYATVGVGIQQHYCCGELHEASLYGMVKGSCGHEPKADGCCKKQPMPELKSCCAKPEILPKPTHSDQCEATSSCCHFDTSFHQLTQSYIAYSFDFQPFTPTEERGATIDEFVFNDISYFPSYPIPPPKTGIERLVWFQVFRS